MIRHDLKEPCPADGAPWSSAAASTRSRCGPIGQTVFPYQANGSLLRGPDGTVVGSRLIAQPFTKDEYFQPRPSAASYDASASASSTLAPSNYLAARPRRRACSDRS